MDKCKFYIIETKYLDLIISKDSIKIDLAKVKAIKNWSTPKRVKDMRAFVRFCNFYRRFIRNFLKIARPLNFLTKKDIAFVWSTECEKTFQELKRRACKASILKHFDQNKQCFVETDFFHYVNAGVLSQRGEDGLLHPVAYLLQRMASAEYNYEIYDKKLLAIIRCFEKWQPELKRTGMLV